MSGQGAKGGQQGYDGGLQTEFGYGPIDQWRQQQQQQMYGQGGMMPFGQGFFSLGRSTRAPFGLGGPNGNGPGLNGGGIGGGVLATLNGANPWGANPLAGNPNNFFGNSNFGNANPGNTQSAGFGTAGSFFGNSGFGPAAPAVGNSYGGSPAPTNPDPNSPEYAAYYNSLAPSTRAYLAAPGSANAWNIYNRANAAAADPNAAHSFIAS